MTLHSTISVLRSIISTGGECDLPGYTDPGTKAVAGLSPSIAGNRCSIALQQGLHREIQFGVVQEQGPHPIAEVSY